MEFFSINSKFYQYMCRIADCMILSVLWFVFSLPIFTAGAASAALYYSCIKVLRQDGGSTIQTFWRAFRNNFKQGCLVSVIFVLLSLGITLFGTLFYRMHPTDDRLNDVYMIYLVLSVAGISWLHYLLSYIARFNNSLMQILKNSLLICIVNLPQSVMMTILFVVVIMLAVLLFPASLGALVFIPAVYCLISSFVLEKIYKKYISAENPEQ